MIRTFYSLFMIAIMCFISTTSNAQVIEIEQQHETFEALCTSDEGKNVSYTLPTNQVRMGNTSNSGPSKFSIKAYQGTSQAGQLRWYLDFKFDGQNPNLFPNSINDADAIITEDVFSISDTSYRDTIQMRRTYKNEWHGVHTIAVFQEKNEQREEAFVVFVHPLKCSRHSRE